MAGEIDIDGAFEALVAAENAALENLERQVSEWAGAIAAQLGNGSEMAAVVAARRELATFTNEFVKYAVDEAVMSALAERITILFDCMEAYLATVADAVRRTYTLAGDGKVMGLVAARGGGFPELQAVTLLPASDLLSFVSFLYTGSQYAPGDAAVIATFNQVQDVVATVESLTALLQVEQTVHWAGHPEKKLVLTDAFRSLVRTGDVNWLAPSGPSKRHLFLFTDMLMYGAAEAGGYGIDKTVSLATTNLKSLENAGVVRNAFSLCLPDAEVKFTCANSVERDSWVNDIQRCILAASTDPRARSGMVDTITAVSDAAGAAERIKARLAVKAATVVPAAPPLPVSTGTTSVILPPPPAPAMVTLPPPPAAPVTVAPAFLPPPPPAVPAPPPSTPAVLPPPPSSAPTPSSSRSGSFALPPPPAAAPSPAPAIPIPPPPSTTSAAPAAAALGATALPRKSVALSFSALRALEGAENGAPPAPAPCPPPPGTLPPPPPSGGAINGRAPPASTSTLPPPPVSAAPVTPGSAISSSTPPPSTGGVILFPRLKAAAAGEKSPPPATSAAFAFQAGSGPTHVPPPPATMGSTGGRVEASKLPPPPPAPGPAASTLPPPPPAASASTGGLPPPPPPPASLAPSGGGHGIVLPPPPSTAGMVGSGGLPPPPPTAGGLLPPPPPSSAEQSRERAMALVNRGSSLASLAAMRKSLAAIPPPPT